MRGFICCRDKLVAGGVRRVREGSRHRHCVVVVVHPRSGYLILFHHRWFCHRTWVLFVVMVVGVAAVGCWEECW